MFSATAPWLLPLFVRQLFGQGTALPVAINFRGQNRSSRFFTLISHFQRRRKSLIDSRLCGHKGANISSRAVSEATLICENRFPFYSSVGSRIRSRVFTFRNIWPAEPIRPTTTSWNGLIIAFPLISSIRPNAAPLLVLVRKWQWPWSEASVSVIGCL